jgi:hypothetical protein
VPDADDVIFPNKPVPRGLSPFVKRDSQTFRPRNYADRSVGVGDLTYDPFGAYDCFAKVRMLVPGARLVEGFKEVVPVGRLDDARQWYCLLKPVAKYGLQHDIFDDYPSEIFLFSAEIEEEVDALNHSCTLGVQVVEEFYALGEQAEPKLTERIEERYSFVRNQSTNCETLGLNIRLATCPFPEVILSPNVDLGLHQQKTVHHESDFCREVDEGSSRGLCEPGVHDGKRPGDLCGAEEVAERDGTKV